MRTNGIARHLMAGTAAIALIAGASAVGSQIDTDFGFVTQAKAQQGQGKMQGGKGGQSGQGGQGAGQGGQGGGQGGQGGVPKASTSDDGDDSDRPDWAGAKGGKAGGGQGGQPSIDRGDLYGDLYVIVRNDNGEPVLYVWEDRDGDGTPEPYPATDGYPQPLAADGSLILLDDEGHPVDESLTQEVELSRLNIARSPDKVTERALDEALDALNAATDVRTDAAGRLEVLIDGESKTIDSPVENMGLYIDLITDGNIDGLTNPVIAAEFPNLVDGNFTVADLQSAATLLGATADKFTALSLDQVMYANDILGVNDPSTGTYIDLTSVDYTRSSVYSGVTAEVLVKQPDGSYVPTTVNIYDAVFGTTDVSGTAAIGYSLAVDDARAVINFIHEYEVPAN